MLNQPYSVISFDWFANNHSINTAIHPGEDDAEQKEYLLPNGFGKGWYQTLRLALGMTMFRAVNYFEPAATGQSILVAEINVELNEPTFQTQIIRGGRVLETQLVPAGNLLLSPGVDLFRYSERYHIAPSLDGSSDSEMTCLSIGRTMLENLIGSADTDSLLNFLGLIPFPQVTAKAIPLHISAHLHGSISSSLLGAARKLHCQARALDYLTALVEHMKSVTGIAVGANSGAGRKRSRDVHAFLMGIEGKLPTLDVLAVQFGCSARLLNQEFTAEYGESIYAFITNQRLLAAHELILKSDVALKALSSRLGYTHVNHFITAFRRKFGYPPGNLRKLAK
jgi:AraC-like DNA-binding protein